MQAAIVTGPGQVPVPADFPEPVAGAGECIVHVAAAAISHVTRARASGAHYSASGQFPFVAGVDGVGRLDDGRRVYFALPTMPYGAMAERTRVPAAQCVALPEGLDEARAAAIANPGMSSWAALVERARIVPGETVMVNGATGASGRLAVRIARHLGARRVIATGRNVAVLDMLGADAAIPLGQDGEALDRAFAAAFADGVDVVIDYLWGDSAERLLVAGAKAGRPIRFVQVGAMSGADIRLPGAVLRASAITLMGSGIGSVPLDRLIVAAGGVLQAAIPAGLDLPIRISPLAAVTHAWTATEGASRPVIRVAP